MKYIYVIINIVYSSYRTIMEEWVEDIVSCFLLNYRHL